MYLFFLLTLLPHITALTTDDITPITPIRPITPITPIINPILPIGRICTAVERTVPAGCVQLMDNNAVMITPENLDGTFISPISRPICTCSWKQSTCSWDCNKPSICPAGVPIVDCFANPCVTNPCDDGEICTANYCGGCFRKCTPKATPAPTLSPTLSPICPRMCIRPLLPPICDIYPILDISVDLSVDPTITPATTTEIPTTARIATGLPPIDITPIVRPRPLPCRCELDECGCSYKRVCPLPGPCGGNPIPKCAYPPQCLLPDIRFDQNGTIDISTSTQRCLYGCELISPCTCQFRCKPPPPVCVANDMKYNVGETYKTGVKNCTICTCKSDRTFECKVDATCLGTCLTPPVCPRPICAVITPDLLTARTVTEVAPTVNEIEARVDVTGIRFCRFGCELDPTRPCECATRCKPPPICHWENRTLSFDESIIIPNTCKICRCTSTGVICTIDLKCQCRLNAESAVSLCPRPICITPDMELIATTEASNGARTISSTSTDVAIRIPPPLVCKYGCELNTTDPCTCQTICRKPPTCEKDGRTYVIGQSYEPEKCQTCTCTEVGFVCTIDRLCQCQAATRCAIPACMTEKGGNATTGEQCIHGCEFDPLKPCGCDTRCLPAPTCPYNGRQVPIGFSYPDDCNTCTCTSSGTFICTKRACPVECLIDPCMLPMRDGKCPYGCRANYTMGCNYECLSPLNATCTIQPIPTIGIIKCPDVCHNVRCPTNTTCTTSSCTNSRCGIAVCIPKQKSTCSVTINGTVQIYEDGDVFAKECNSCTCTSTGVICTKKACIDPCLSPPMCPAIWNPPPYCMFEFDTDMELSSSHHGIHSIGTVEKPCVCERSPCSCGFRCKAKQPTCKWEGDGQVYQVGQTFPKDCHNCVCLPNGNVTCYRRPCIPTPCIYNNITYTAGQTFPPNCNNMECRPDGTIVVLRKTCIETCVACFVDPCRVNTCPEGTVCQTPKCPQNCDYTCVAPTSCTWNNQTYAINQTFPEKCPICQCMPNGQVDCTRDRVACNEPTEAPSSTSVVSNTSTSTGLESNTTEPTSVPSSTGIDTSNTTSISSTTILSSTATTIDSSSSSTRPQNNTCNVPSIGGEVRVYIVGESFEIVTTGLCERCTCSETTRLICSIIDCRGININLTASGAIPMTSPSISFYGLFIAILITIMAFIRI